MTPAESPSPPLDDAIRSAIHPELIAWLFSELDESEREAFRKGLNAPLHALVEAFTGPPDIDAPATVLTELLRYLDSWVLSVQVSRDPGWREGMAESSQLIEANESSVATADDLRELIG